MDRQGPNKSDTVKGIVLAFVNTALNLLLPLYEGNYFKSWESNNLSRTNVFHGVNQSFKFCLFIFFLNLNMQIVQRSHFFFLEFRVLFLPVMWKPLPSFPYLVSVLMPFVIATAASQLFAILSSARSIGKDRFFYAASCLCRWFTWFIKHLASLPTLFTFLLYWSPVLIL